MDHLVDLTVVLIRTGVTVFLGTVINSLLKAVRASGDSSG